MKLAPLSLVAVFAVWACTASHHKSAAVSPSGTDRSGFDWYGDSVRKLVRLDQGWTVADSNWFYWTTQGSQLLPYAFFLAQEQPNDRTLSRDRHNMLKSRFLPERPSAANPDGLPVGLVAIPTRRFRQTSSVIGARSVLRAPAATPLKSTIKGQGCESMAPRRWATSLVFLPN